MSVHPYTRLFAQTIDPTVTDDVDSGYEIGDIWVTAASSWQCLDASSGAAVWLDLTAGGGGTTDEHIQDVVGAMFTGNTETRITADYQDSDGTIDLVVDTFPTVPTTEEIEDIIGAMVSGNTETGIDVTYDDAGAKLNFDAQTAGDLRYAPIAKGVTNGDSHDHVGGDGGAIAYGSLSGAPTIPDTEAIQDAAGAMFGSNTVRGIVSTYDDATGKVNLDAPGYQDGKYTWSTSTAGAPSSGGIRFNSGTFGAVTELATHLTSALGTDMTFTLRNVDSGDRIYIQKDGNSAVWRIMNVTGSYTDNTTWYSIPVDGYQTSGSLSNADTVLIAVLKRGNLPEAYTLEQIQDMVGNMVGNIGTETGIAVTYDDPNGWLHFDAQTAGDLRYAPIANGVTNGDTHNHFGGDGGAIDIANLTGVASGTWSPTTSGITLGTGGTVVATYVTIGKIEFGTILATLGTSGVLTGDVSFTFRTTISKLGNAQVQLFDAGVLAYDGIADNNTTTIFARVKKRNASDYIITANLSATVPFTWGNTDNIRVQFWAILP